MLSAQMTFFMAALLAMLAVSASSRASARLERIGWIAHLGDAAERFAARYYWLLFALTLVLGIVVRVYRFPELPLGINQDGAWAGVEALCLAHGGVDQYGTSLPTYFESWQTMQMSTLYSYLLAPLVKVFGLSKLTLRLPMLTISLLSLVVLWDFARRMLGRGYALLVLFFAAVCPWHILQSRWALEANLFPHVLLLGCYLLFLGQNRRWALYLSMAVFGLSLYAYGLASLVVPPLLVALAVYYAAKHRVRWFDLVLCIAVFLAVGGPFLLTMAINAFGWETMHLGPFTLPLCAQSTRSGDLVFMRNDVGDVFFSNAITALQSTFLQSGLMPAEGAFNAIPAYNTLYPFMVPAILLGIPWLWHDRRRSAHAVHPQDAFCAGGMIVLCALASATAVALFSLDCNVNRANAVYYPLMLCAGYALYRMGKRVRIFLPCVVLMLLCCFSGLVQTYFTDENYIRAVAQEFHSGAQEALVFSRGWDCDRYYVYAGPGILETPKIMEGQLMFAHEIDAQQRLDECELKDANGEPTGWYYSQLYEVRMMDADELNPDECAVHVAPAVYRPLFEGEDYRIWDFDRFFVAYPVYWMED